MPPLAADPLFWLLAIAGVVITGISKSGFAGGAGVVAVPLLALVMPIPAATALILPLLLVMDARTVMLYRRAIVWRDLIAICSAAAVGIALAGTALAALPAAGLQWVLAIFCLLFASWQRLMPLLGQLPGAAWLWGTLSGISSTLLHAGGPPITIYFLASGLEKRVWLAQASVFFALMNVMKLVPYTLNGQWQQGLFWLDVLLIPAALIGVRLGYLLQARLAEKDFMLICRVLLGVAGVLLLARAL
jgi:uncharacterized membrane protein YfcA